MLATLKEMMKPPGLITDPQGQGVRWPPPGPALAAKASRLSATGREGSARGQPLHFNFRHSMMGWRMISMAKPILPPGTTMLLRRLMKESWIMDSR